MMRGIALLVVLWAPGQAKPVIGVEQITADLRGREIHVEGVFSGRVGGNDESFLRLRQSSIRFMLGRLELDRLKPNTNLRLTGVVRVEKARDGTGDELVVYLSRVEILPDDLEQLKAKIAQLPDDNPQPWYQLAAWAAERYRQYGWQPVNERAAWLFEQAVQVHHRQARGDAKELRGLAERVRQEKRPVHFDLLGLEHEIARLEYQKLPSNNAAAVQQFANQLRERFLPAGDVRLPPLPEDDQHRYNADPLGAFAEAAGQLTMRQRLIRHWIVMLTQRRFELEYQASGQNAVTAFALADQAKTAAPEYPQWAAKWNQRGLELALAKLDALSREEVDQLAARADSGTSETLAPATIRRRWFDSQERRILKREGEARTRALQQGQQPPTRDAHARHELALILLGWFPEDAVQREKVRQMLNDVLAIDPTFAEAEARLRALGYLPNKQGEWTASGGAATAGGAPAGVKIGDRGDRVRQLFGEPAVATKVVGKGWALLYWEYEGFVYVLRESSPEGTPFVIAIHRG